MDFQNAKLVCVSGTGEYVFSDVQDTVSGESICAYGPEYAFPIAGEGDYNNADVQPRPEAITDPENPPAGPSFPSLCPVRRTLTAVIRWWYGQSSGGDADVVAGRGAGSEERCGRDFRESSVGCEQCRWFVRERQGRQLRGKQQRQQQRRRRWQQIRRHPHDTSSWCERGRWSERRAEEMLR